MQERGYRNTPVNASNSLDRLNEAFLRELDGLAGFSPDSNQNTGSKLHTHHNDLGNNQTNNDDAAYNQFMLPVRIKGDLKEL